MHMAFHEQSDDVTEAQRKKCRLLEIGMINALQIRS